MVLQSSLQFTELMPPMDDFSNSLLESLEQYARYPLMQKRVTPGGCLSLFRRQIYLDVALRGKEVTCYETVEGLEVRGTMHRVYLLRDYRRWQNRYWWKWGREIP